MLPTGKSIIAAVLALALATGPSAAVFAASGHGHDGHGAAAAEMQLDHGRKWQGDEVLRTGMTRIRASVAAALPKIHDGRFTPAEYAALAGQVQEQADHVVANCKLPEEADRQLHVALERMLEGVGAMQGESGQKQGVVAIVQALNAYGEHFEHPGWRPLGD